MEKFVKEFLKIGNLNSAQKDKMIELFERDRFQNFENKILDKVENSQKNIVDKIQKLEDKIFNGVPNSEIEKLTEIQKVENQKKTNIQEETETSEKPEIYTDPFGDKSLSKFLRAYNQDNLLKYTWHTIDKETIKDDNDEEFSVKDYIIKLSSTEKYSVREHQKLLAKRFEELTKKFFITQQVYALLKTYLKGENTKKWSSNNIEINWASEELFKWSDENIDYIPNANGKLKKEQGGEIFELPQAFTSNINGNRIRDFSELIIHSKNLFHIRPNNSLKSILEYAIKQNEWENIEFDFDNINDYVEIFTDVDKLIQFFTEYINLICSICEKPGNQKNKIILSLVEEGSFINFIIHHTNQTYLKTSESTLYRRGSTYTSLKNKINGMCELWLEADFHNEPSYRINLWTGEWNREEKKYFPKPMQKEEIEKVNGVKHILKFKR